jgi:hypothetical protein
MKANELMIGNWVRLVNVYGVQQDEAICLDGMDIYRVWAGKYTVEPIPITRELLEDNGWEREDVPCGADGGIEIWVSPEHRVELRSNKNHDMCNSDAAWYIHIDDEYFRSIGSGEVTYLHELQNECNCKHYQFEWKV